MTEYVLTVAHNFPGLSKTPLGHLLLGKVVKSHLEKLLELEEMYL